MDHPQDSWSTEDGVQRVDIKEERVSGVRILESENLWAGEERRDWCWGRGR